MKLTKLERRILINQFEILKMLNPEENKFYEEYITILSDGYELFYSQIEEWLSDDLPAEECKLVIDVLDIYRAIGRYKERGGKNKEILEHHWLQFRGFDGNEETQYLGFTNFLINKQGKFQEQVKSDEHDTDFNSHHPVLDKYKSMVSRWYELGHHYELSEDEIKTILNS